MPAVHDCVYYNNNNNNNFLRAHFYPIVSQSNVYDMYIMISPWCWPIIIVQVPSPFQPLWQSLWQNWNIQGRMQKIAKGSSSRHAGKSRPSLSARAFSVFCHHRGGMHTVWFHASTLSKGTRYIHCALVQQMDHVGQKSCSINLRSQWTWKVTAFVLSVG